jgi:transcription elongation factor Elf1
MSVGNGAIHIYKKIRCQHCGKETDVLFKNNHGVLHCSCGAVINIDIKV